MQSFFQSRRFGKHVQEQYERDKAQAVALSLEAYEKQQQEQSGLSRSHGNVATKHIAQQVRGQYDDSTGAFKSTSQPHDDNRDIEKVALHPQISRKHKSSLPLQEKPLPETPIEARQSLGTALGTVLTGITVKGHKTKSSTSKRVEVFLVSYEGDDDPLDPHHWSYAVRLAATMNVALVAFVVGFASSIDSAILDKAMSDFHVSEVVETLSTGLFLIGFGVGAVFAGPASETLGRNPVYIGTLIVYMLFIMGSGLAQTITQQLVCRFLAGCFAATPLNCAGGTMSDLWSPIERTWAFPIFANAAFMGPVIGAVITNLVAQPSNLTWRWTEWITLLVSAAVLTSISLFQRETYAPILLHWKAKKLRNLTGDRRFKSEIEMRNDRFPSRLASAMKRMVVMTSTELIIILIALYLTVIYIILFTFLQGYTFIFSDAYNFNHTLTGLSFFGLAIGLCLATLCTPFIYYLTCRNLVAPTPGSAIPRPHPESRLYFAMLGAPAIPIGLLWMGWTTGRGDISPWSPLAASVLVGFGIPCIFITSYEYIIDSYETYAASALTSVTLIRYVAAGGAVELANTVYSRLGVGWTLTLLAGLSAVMVPVPYAFWRFGERVRRKSKWTID